MVILFVAISADNYIAAKDGSVAFLDEVNAWGQEHNLMEDFLHCLRHAR